MKKIMCLLCAIPVAACNTIMPPSPPEVTLIVDPRVQQMSRNEVINAIHECEGGNMRAVPIISKRLVSGLMSDIVIDVQCYPRLRYFMQ
jgi:hypothetical protein